MGLRYVPIPDEAYACVDGPLQLAFMALLYKEFHDRRWRSLSRSLKSMARDSGIPHTSLRRLFQRLEGAGLLEFSAEKVGNRSEGTRFRLLDPEVVHDAVHEWSTETKVNGASPDESGPRVVHDAVHGFNSRRARCSDPDPDSSLGLRLTPKTIKSGLDETEASTVPPSGSPPATPVCFSSFEESWDLLTDYWVSDVSPALGRQRHRKPVGTSKVGKKLTNEVRKDPDQVLDAFRYVAHGQTQHAEWLRAQGHGLQTILRHVEDYAERWRDGPREAPAPKVNENRGFRMVREYQERQAAKQRAALALDAREVPHAK